MNKTILVVDDSDLFRSVMSKLLEAAGYRILLAPNGEYGFLVFKQMRPDLILMDLLMPAQTGAQLIQKIRQQPEGKTIPVIMMTGMLGSGTLAADAVNTWGVNAFFSKDADFSLVLQKIQELLNPKASQPAES